MLDLKALLSKTLNAIYSKTYNASASKTITNTAIDTLTKGASITVPGGNRSYVIVGQWTFYTGTGTSGRNIQVVIKNDLTNSIVAQHRVFAAQANWACLQAVYITEEVTGSTTYSVYGSSSMTYTTATNNWIKAIPIGSR